MEGRRKRGSLEIAEPPGGQRLQRMRRLGGVSRASGPPETLTSGERLCAAILTGLEGEPAEGEVPRHRDGLGMRFQFLEEASSTLN